MGFSESQRPRGGGFAGFSENKGGALGDFAEGVTLGLTRDPLIGGLVSSFVSIFPEFQDTNVQEQLASRLNEGAAAGKIGTTAGELIALLGPGVGAFGLSRAALRGVLAKHGTGKAAQFLRQGAPGGFSRQSLSRGIDPSSPIPKFGPRAHIPNPNFQAFPEMAKGLGRPPVGLRLGESAAGSAGLGVEGGARAVAEGEEDLNEIFKRAGLNAAFAFGGETALIGLGRTPMVQRLLGVRGGDAAASLDALDPDIVAKKAGLEAKLTEVTDKIVNRVMGRIQSGPKAGQLRPELTEAPQVGLSDFVAAFRVDNPVKAVARQARRAAGLQRSIADLPPAQYRAAQLVHFRQLEVELKRLDKELGAKGIFGGGKIQEVTRAEFEKTLETQGAIAVGRPAGRLRGQVKALRTKRQNLETAKARIGSNLEQLRGEPRHNIAGIIPTIERGGSLPQYADDLRVARRKGATADKMSDGLEHFQDTLYGDAFFPAREINRKMTQLIDSIAKSPETILREMGTTGIIGLDLGRLAAMESRFNGNIANLRLIKNFRALAHATMLPSNRTNLRAPLGSRTFFANFDTRNGGKWAQPIVETYTSPTGGGIAGVKARFGSEVGEAWQAIVKDMDSMYDDLARIGVVPARLSDNILLDKQEVSNFFPQIWNLSSEKKRQLAVAKLKGLFKRSGFDDTDAEMRAVGYMGTAETNRIKGMRGAGNADFQSLVPGTVGAKTDAGLKMVDDPFRVLQQWYGTATLRQSYGKYFGLNVPNQGKGKLIGKQKLQSGFKDALIRSAEIEGVDVGRAREVIDQISGSTFRDGFNLKLARTFGNLEIMAKLGLAAFPNFSQGINDVLANGARNYVRGLSKTFAVTGRKDIAAAIGIGDWARQSFMRNALDDLAGVSGTVATAPFDKAASTFLRGNLFSVAESWNRTQGASVALVTFRHTVEQLERGALRGHNFARAERRFADLGIDMRQLMRDGFHRGDPAAWRAIEMKAAYRGSQLTQFVPDPTRIPRFWQTPVGRTMFQFKSFAFNQAKFIRDNVIKEAVEGNMKPLAYFMTLYPIAGATVREGVNLFRENPKNPNGLWWYIDALATVGGFGLIESTMRSLYFDDARGLVAGPTFNDMMTAAEIMVQPERFEAIQKEMERQPTFRLGRTGFGATAGVGGLFSESLDKMLESYRGEVGVGGFDEPSVSTDELLQQRIRARQGR